MSAPDTDKLFLIDGHALAYRSHFAFINANLKNADGIPTGPLLGFANTLVKLLETEEPTHVAVAWDTSAPTFRHEMDENYKANRPPQPDELRQTIPLMKEMVEYLGFQNLEQDGYEADDIIGTIATEAGAAGTDVFMVTPDKDFMQLVTENVRMLKPLTKGDGFQVIDPGGVADYFGVPPEKVVDVLAIIGDTSDNIPGVPGIGKKGAPKLIQEYGSLEAAIEAAPGMTAKRAKKGLTENKEQALLSKKMIVINTEVSDTCSWKELAWEGPKTESLVDFFKRMEFNTLRRKFSGESTPPKAADSAQGDLFGGSGAAGPESGQADLKTYTPDEADYKLVKTPDALAALADVLAGADAVCFDTETTGTDALTAELLGLAFAVNAGEAWYVAVDESGEQGLPLAGIKKALAGFLNAETLKIAHNYKYDYSILRRHGMHLKGRIFDTMIAAYLINSGQRLSMDELSRRYLNYSPISITELIGKGKQQKSMRDIPLEDLYVYACEDADITFQLYELLHQKLEEDALIEVAERLEFPLIPVLAHMELSGVKLDTDMLAGFSQQLGEDMQRVQEKIYEAAGEAFNINSPAQLSKILFEKLELPSGKKTKSGNYSTSEQILSELAHSYEIASLVLDYRSLSKLKSTYADVLPKLINEESGRVHTSFNQQIAATGRLSSSQPNLQNIPIRTERGREIRKAFIAEEGYSLVAVDYSQIELRVIASISEDTAMTEAFRNDEDIHARTAREIFGLEANEDVDREMRRKAKEVNFGIPYGVSAFGLAQRLGIDRTEAKTIIDAYFERFPGIRRYINETTEFAREKGYVTTLMNRRRYIPEIRSSNPNRRGFAERTAINMPIQGTAAELIKVAMLRIDAFLEAQEGPDVTRMVLQVHDELLFEIPDKDLESMLPRITSIMEGAMELKVPLKVEPGIAKNWLEAH